MPDLTYTSYILAAMLSFVGSLLLLGCLIASVHYVKYAYRYWCISCHSVELPSKKSSSVLSITSYFKQPSRISRSRTSLQQQTVIIAHPTTRHPMTVLYGHCLDNPPPYAIVAHSRTDLDKRPGSASASSSRRSSSDLLKQSTAESDRRLAEALEKLEDGESSSTATAESSNSRPTPSAPKSYGICPPTTRPPYMLV